ncbi:MAG: type I restriction enzyme HsdR N-terminal domain-containing protein [Candidatus Pseudobacter hemicellulosilyticus]|uniref:Type I restriction enzyme HsdR N-terminal domain-containing protein n=1 Tax=Candidatus Pseudobacter hemicellulosilyticus TaxID=3121375 RepID=A0AAJ5WZT6_9BACT|nr:MAG: type I restriction enzyme HsdR N-terminal domain-containing protein [Pseudobacter sp.]
MVALADMVRIDYPAHPFRLKKENDKEFIFDELRKIWVRLTPEEWVRQHLLQYMLQVQGYPASLIAVEKELRLGELKKRFDILVYNAHHQPWLMVECKSTDVPLTQEVLQQVLRYNIAVPVDYLVISNGHYHAGFRKEDGRLQAIDALPPFEK